MKYANLRRIAERLKPGWLVTLIFVLFFAVLGILDQILDCILPFTI